MADFMKTCADLIQSRPDIMNNPRTSKAAHEALDIFNSGDEQAGIEMANRILQNLGTTRQGFFQSLASLLSRRK